MKSRRKRMEEGEEEDEEEGKPYICIGGSAQLECDVVVLRNYMNVVY